MKKGIILLLIINLLLFSICIYSCKKDNNEINNPSDTEEYKISDIEIICPKEVYLGESIEFKVTTFPKDYFKYEISFRDDNEVEDVIRIDGNTIYGLYPGVAYITVTSIDDNKIQDDCVVEVLHPLLELDEYEATEIVGFYGSNASSDYEINYQIKNTKSYVLLTTSNDPEFKEAKAYYGNGYYFEQIDDRLQYNFYPRNVWHVSIKGLDSGTDYIYKINNGNDTYSNIYHFTTASKKDTSFLFLTDNHYYDKTDGSISSAAVSEETIKHAKEIDPNLSFIVGGGDRIDHGGNDLGWKNYFKYAKSLESFPFIDTPGNHEYYSNLTGYGNTYFSLYTAGADNGCMGLNGSTCYTLHNETLIIMMDNSTNKAYDEQMAWVANLLETKVYTYSIIVFHKPCNIPGSQDYNPDMIKLCDKYSIDLVLCGHYHTENVSVNYYNEAPTDNPYLGTTYFLGTFSGIKSASSPENAVNEAKGYIVDCTFDGIKIRSILANGTILKEWNIDNRTPLTHIGKHSKELIEATEIVKDEENNSLNLIFNEYFFGNVKKVIVRDVLRNKIMEDMVFPSPAYTSMTINNIVPNYDYLFELIMIFRDDEVYTTSIEWNRHEPINLRDKLVLEDYIELTFDEVPNDLNYQIRNYEVYVNGRLMMVNDYEIDGRLNNRIVLTNLNSQTKYDIKLIFFNFSKEQLFSEDISVITE